MRFWMPFAIYLSIYALSKTLRIVGLARPSALASAVIVVLTVAYFIDPLESQFRRRYWALVLALAAGLYAWAYYRP